MNFEIAPKSSEIQANWDDAKLYCFSLNIDGNTGWRLPTIEELEEIHQSENDFKKDWYWSATVSADPDTIRTFNFCYGERGFCSKDSEDDLVRAVRDLKDNRKPLDIPT